MRALRSTIFGLVALIASGCTTPLFLLTTQAVTVETGQVFRVIVGDDAMTDAVRPSVPALPVGFTLESQNGRSLVFRAPIYPGVSIIKYRLVVEENGDERIVSDDGEIVVTVNAPGSSEGVECTGPAVALTLASVTNSGAGTVSTGSFVTTITTSPVLATVRRKNDAGDYRAGSLAVSFTESGLTALGTVSEADFAAYPILEFDVTAIGGVASTNPGDDWTCRVSP